MTKRIKSIVRGDIIALYTLRGYLASQYPCHDIYCCLSGTNDDAKMRLDFDPDENLGLFDSGKLDAAIGWLASRNDACKTLRSEHL